MTIQLYNSSMHSRPELVSALDRIMAEVSMVHLYKYKFDKKLKLVAKNALYSGQGSPMLHNDHTLNDYTFT